MDPTSPQQQETTPCDPATTSEKAIKDHLEDVVRGLYRFLNGPAEENDPVAYHLSPSGIETNAPGESHTKTLSPQDFMRRMSLLKKYYPSFHVEVESVEVLVNMDSKVNKQQPCRDSYGFAEVWANFAATGGIGYLDSCKRYVNYLEYRFTAGRWVCVKGMVIDGMSGDAF